MRKYHFGATLLVLGLALWVLYGVLALTVKVNANLTQTHCNQGLLLLATQNIYDESRIAECPADIRMQVQGVK